MDRVTREAIDERLRVLEGVSGAVSRCIEDLVRMRSALPVTSAPRTQTPVAPPLSQPQQEEGSASSKGKATVVATSSMSNAELIDQDRSAAVGNTVPESPVTSLPLQDDTSVANLGPTA